jgi:hypothetical protein
MEIGITERTDLTADWFGVRNKKARHNAGLFEV